MADPSTTGGQGMSPAPPDSSRRYLDEFAAALYTYVVAWSMLQRAGLQVALDLQSMVLQTSGLLLDAATQMNRGLAERAAPMAWLPPAVMSVGEWPSVSVDADTGDFEEHLASLRSFQTPAGMIASEYYWSDK